MNIYYISSIAAKDRYQKNFELINEILERLYGSVQNDHILKTSIDDVKNKGSEERAEYYKTFQKWIKSSDIVVAEISFPSTINVGHEITRAMDLEKPVLALYSKGNSPMFLEGFQSDKFILQEYNPDDTQELERIISRSIKKLMKSTDIRFNFFISPEISRYLDWVKRYNRVPISVYLRDKIQEDMDNNKEYQDYLNQ